MLVLIAIALAIFVLPQPWGLVAIVVGATLDVTEVIVFRWWSRRGPARVGLDALVGRTAVALSSLAPSGQVRVGGEIWQARSDSPDSPVLRGDEVVILEVEELTLVVGRA